MSSKIQLRRGTAAQWSSANPTLAAGEIGLETDTHHQKIGDGVTAWTALAYATHPEIVAATSTQTANTLVRRTAGGSASFGNIDSNMAPTPPQHATRKDYVDGQDAA